MEPRWNGYNMSVMVVRQGHFPGAHIKGAGLMRSMLLQDMQRPLYMQPKDAIEYGIIDGIVRPQTDIIDEVMNAEQWDKQAGLVAR